MLSTSSNQCIRKNMRHSLNGGYAVQAAPSVHYAEEHRTRKTVAIIVAATTTILNTSFHSGPTCMEYVGPTWPKLNQCDGAKKSIPGVQLQFYIHTRYGRTALGGYSSAVLSQWHSKMPCLLPVWFTPPHCGCVHWERALSAIKCPPDEPACFQCFIFLIQFCFKVNLKMSN